MMLTRTYQIAWKPPPKVPSISTEIDETKALKWPLTMYSNLLRTPFM